MSCKTQYWETQATVARQMDPHRLEIHLAELSSACDYLEMGSGLTPLTDFAFHMGLTEAWEMWDNFNTEHVLDD